MVSQQGNEGKQAQQRWRGTSHRQGIPLALGFKAEVGADFRKGDFNTPAPAEPLDELLGRGVGVSGN
jgi:hypothetical protein